MSDRCHRALLCLLTIILTQCVDLGQCTSNNHVTEFLRRSQRGISVEDAAERGRKGVAGVEGLLDLQGRQAGQPADGQTMVVRYRVRRSAEPPSTEDLGYGTKVFLCVVLGMVIAVGLISTARHMNKAARESHPYGDLDAFDLKAVDMIHKSPGRPLGAVPPPGPAGPPPNNPYGRRSPPHKLPFGPHPMPRKSRESSSAPPNKRRRKTEPHTMSFICALYGIPRVSQNKENRAKKSLEKVQRAPEKPKFVHKPQGIGGDFDGGGGGGGGGGPGGAGGTGGNIKEEVEELEFTSEELEVPMTIPPPTRGNTPDPDSD